MQGGLLRRTVHVEGALSLALVLVANLKAPAARRKGDVPALERAPVRRAQDEFASPFDSEADDMTEKSS
jgi:hypothetical protein